ncbi:MAG TPA: DNA N-6-adenine-methyltransferase, partial [Candidatus Nitrosocosmicus sp.]|nr:DNA N-6-adenine-methyltransferase [Candidatus Nitrosocosmicus sp.]
MFNRALFQTGKNDDWETPKPLFDFLNGVFNFYLDPCARETIESQNRIKTRYKYTKDDDGLALDWGNYSTFINPPYSKIKYWIKKAISEFDMRVEVYKDDPARQYKPNPIVLLMPARTDTRWFHQIACHP